MTTLREQFQIVKNLDESFKTQGGLLYTTLFDLAPELRPVFSFGKLEGEEYERKKEFQGANTFRTIEKTLEQFGTEISTKRLHAMGVRHKEKYGVLPVHYDIVGEALIRVVTQVFGDKLTPELKRIWVIGYGLIAHGMSDGVY